MYEILRDIFSSDLSKVLAFKWWTLCYFFHNLDRFSTDLDFDIIGENYSDIKIIQILQKYWTIKNTGRNLKINSSMNSSDS